MNPKLDIEERKEERLKPCPCGNDFIAVEECPGIVELRCNNAECNWGFLFLGDREDAIKSWNTRADSDLAKKILWDIKTKTNCLYTGNIKTEKLLEIFKSHGITLD